MTSAAVDYSDQTRIFDPDNLPDTLTLIGLGGIGASALPTLVTMGIRNFVLWDPDFVEPRNVASQLLYKPTDLGRSKAEVCKEYLLAYGAERVVVYEEMFDENSSLEDGIVICGVDSMEARQIIWENIKNSPQMINLYVDGRIGGQHATLFCVEPWESTQHGRYEKSLLVKVAPLPCAERAIAYPAVMLGAVMASRIAAFTRGVPVLSRWEGNLGDMPTFS